MSAPVQNMSDLFVWSETRVFWDVGDFPAPPGTCIKLFREIVERALLIEGYRCYDFSIKGYDAGKLPFRLLGHYVMAGVSFDLRAEEKCTRLNCMLGDMINWAFESMNPPRAVPRQINLLVIAKDIPGGDTEFVRVCHDLQETGFNVFLIVPDDCPRKEVPPPTTAKLVWRWTSLFHGGLPVDAEDKYLLKPASFH
ncbi:uncharacterized protein LOC111830546 [Capsella rubella]|uniref:uncharacterized protein LOC111830546 n=1 Tax=Capsella rubella TaxID=81985 RepID=UPI000CD4D9FF|nr:uncharacterized protein LOC111830546 [Capsella rubella]